MGRSCVSWFRAFVIRACATAVPAVLKSSYGSLNTADTAAAHNAIGLTHSLFRTTRNPRFTQRLCGTFQLRNDDRVQIG